MRTPLLLLLLWPAWSAAGTVHQWVDSDGVTHFSDTPPTTTDVDVTTIEIGDHYPAAADVENDYYSIANQWKRLRDERLAREERRFARSRAAQPPPAPAPVNAIEEEPRYVGYYPYAYRHHPSVGHVGFGQRGFGHAAGLGFGQRRGATYRRAGDAGFRGHFNVGGAGRSGHSIGHGGFRGRSGHLSSGFGLSINLR